MSSYVLVGYWLCVHWFHPPCDKHCLMCYWWVVDTWGRRSWTWTKTKAQDANHQQCLPPRQWQAHDLWWKPPSVPRGALPCGYSRVHVTTCLFIVLIGGHHPSMPIYQLIACASPYTHDLWRSKRMETQNRGWACVSGVVWSGCKLLRQVLALSERKYQDSFGDGYIYHVAKTMCGGQEGTTLQIAIQHIRHACSIVSMHWLTWLHAGTIIVQMVSLYSPQVTFSTYIQTYTFHVRLCLLLYRRLSLPLCVNESKVCWLCLVHMCGLRCSSGP